MMMLGENMKKIIIALFCLTVTYSFLNQDTNIIIPDEAIRFRIIANSNSEADQNLKLQIKENIETELNNHMKTAKNIEEARNEIKQAIPNIENIMNRYQISYKINFGMNEFPKKEYKGVTYPSGKYESLVITLGQGLGDNWWCVMFPPLCLIEAEESEKENIEYKFYISEVLKSFGMN